jgi:hypothetical protein
VHVRTTVFWLSIALAGGWPSPASAESARIYLGGAAGVNGGSRGPVDVGSVRTAGGVVGIRVSEGWSIELEVDQGFGSSRREDPEGFWLSHAPPGSTREEIERVGVRARFTRIDTTGAGVSAQVVWKTREPGRVNAAFFGGVAQRSFDKRTIRTITHVPEEANIPPNDPNVRDADETRTITGGGLTGGVMVPVKLTGALSIAPEFRLTLGLITDESTYKIFTAGVRMLWRF